MNLGRRLLVGAAGFALSAAPAYAAFYPPLHERVVGEGPPLLATAAAMWVLAGGGITLYHVQEDPGGPGRWTLRYLLLLLFFASGFFLIKVNWAGPAGDLFAGMTGAGVLGGMWALFRGYRHRMGACFLLPAALTGLGDVAGWGVWSLAGGLAGWTLWGALSGAGLGSGLALALHEMARSEPRNQLQEELETHRREEEDRGRR